MSDAKSFDTTFLDTANAIGGRLCRDAIWAGGRCNWLGDAMEYVDGRWQVGHRAFGPDLYGGVSGIGLFLAQLFSHTQEKTFKKTALGAMECGLSQLERFNAHRDFGFYSGLTGFAYALIEVGDLLDQQQLVERGLRTLETIPREGLISQTWDIVSGSAGIIPVMLKIHGRYGQDFLLDVVFQHGEMLLESANRSEDGWSWKTIQGPEQRDLTGFSHGAAGIAWAFLELHKKFNEQKFLQAAQEALRYERRWFDPQQENWPDFRFDGEAGSAPGFSAAWCHGAPGIGLSRVRAYQILQDATCRAEAEAALRTTTRTLQAALQSGQGNYSLCHGNCGNAELLIYASDVLPHNDRLKIIREVAEDGVRKYRMERNPWPCGVLNGGETPNLMLGLAGIGYFYLRMHDRKKVPSVLIVGPES
jgi:type 2 lantibiotic biosynthesis protein LanM